MAVTDIVLIFGGIAVGVVVAAFAASRGAQDRNHMFRRLALGGLAVFAVLCLAMYFWFPLAVNSRAN